MITIEIKDADKCSSDYSMFISFPYNIDIINVIRALPYRYWHSDKKVWEVPLDKLEYLKNQFNGLDLNIIDKSSILSKQTEKVDLSTLNHKFKLKPFKHQIDGFNYGMTHDKWLLSDEMGLGKSAQVINIAIARKNLFNYKHCLIICGINTLKWNWVEEIQKHSDEKAYILGQRIKKDKIVVNSNADKIDDLHNLPDDYFLITNVQSFQNTEIVDLVKKQCKQGNINMIAIDEAHKCLGNFVTSAQGKNVLKLKSGCMIAMTGTPLLNSPLDLYGILRWLGYEDHTKYAFKNHYCELGGFGGYQTIGYKNLNELQKKLQDIQLRRLKKDVLDLPEKIYINEYIEMTLNQTKIYNEILGDLRINVDKIKSSNNPLAEMIRLRQATGYTGILSSEIQESAKLDRMEELVEEAVANNNKVVIFSNWTSITDEIYKRLSSKYCGVQVTGQIKDEDRQKAKEEFQNNPKCMFMIGTNGAMGVGITLTAAHIEIFMDIPWNKGSWEQCIDRCHRIGQTENLTIYNLMCKDTIDEKIYNLVEQKGAMSNLLVDGIPQDKGKVVDYLLS